MHIDLLAKLLTFRLLLVKIGHPLLKTGFSGDIRIN